MLAARCFLLLGLASMWVGPLPLLFLFSRYDGSRRALKNFLLLNMKMKLAIYLWGKHMVSSNMLLQLIMRLQQGISVTDGRRILLEYARKSSGAQLGLLFLVDKERQGLTLLEQAGRHYIDSDSSPCDIHTFVPLNGLFGSALHAQRLVNIADIASDPRSLEEERYWAEPGSHVILSPVGTAARRGGAQGVLVLCFSPSHKQGSQERGDQAASKNALIYDATREGNLLICVSLLSAYLTESNVKSMFSHNYEVLLAEQNAVIDRERRRIARDIHDGAAQNIAHVLHKLEFIRRTIEKQPQVALHELGRAYDILEESLKDLRHGISSLLPTQLEEQGFDAALSALVDEYATSELTINYDRTKIDLLPSSLEVPVYRFVQEALNNVRKHARASHVVISIRILPNMLVVQVKDNGVGFSAKRGLSSAPRFGLRTMRERIQQAGGYLEISSKAGEGTSLKATFSLTTPATILTRREREVLRLLVEGATNRAIAEALSVSIETVKSHVHHIMQKMHVKDRTQAAVIATKQQWL